MELYIAVSGFDEHTGENASIHVVKNLHQI